MRNLRKFSHNLNTKVETQSEKNVLEVSTSSYQLNQQVQATLDPKFKRLTYLQERGTKMVKFYFEKLSDLVLKHAFMQ